MAAAQLNVDTELKIQTVIHDLYGKRYSSPNNNSHSNTRESSKSSAIVSEEYPKSHPKSPPQKLSVQLKPLAFYSHISDVLPPSLVSSSKHKIAHTSHHQLRITHHQADILCKGKIQGLGHSMIQKCPKNHTQIQLRFCKMDTSGDQPDCFPPNVSVKINSVMVVLPNFIPPTKAGVSPRRPNIPVDVTKMFFRSPCSQNTMEVRYSDHNTDFPTKYCVAVSVVEQLFADDLLQGLKSNAVQSANTTKLKIIDKLKKDLDSDVSTTNLKLSLLCPLGKMRMSTPVRGIKCTHLQCFDAMLYLRMNERKPTWLCPVCDKPADYDSLVIDGLFIEILDECKTEEIDFTSDGNWHASKKHTETLVIGTPIKPIALDLSQNARVSRTVEKKKQPDVIDLTGDSSDDDDDSRIEIHSSNHNSGSETVADDATMSISSS
uniref:SP-RING-type domain-containing protein n=1 Tax=Ciona savignyi TaxID=51511 RepID=H2Y942_CIOSA